jgi:hypothetical protein
MSKAEIVVRASIAGCVAAALLAGCSGPAPTFRVLDIEVSDESPQATVVTVTLEGENRGEEALPLRDVRYTLSLDGRPVFSGVRSAEATLPAGGVERVRLPVAITAEQAGGPLTGTQRPYSLSGSVQYLSSGSIAEVLFDSGLRQPTASFSESGSLDFAKP